MLLVFLNLVAWQAESWAPWVIGQHRKSFSLDAVLKTLQIDTVNQLAHLYVQNTAKMSESPAGRKPLNQLFSSFSTTIFEASDIGTLWQYPHLFCFPIYT